MEISSKLKGEIYTNTVLVYGRGMLYIKGPKKGGIKIKTMWGEDEERKNRSLLKSC